MSDDTPKNAPEIVPDGDLDKAVGGAIPTLVPKNPPIGGGGPRDPGDGGGGPAPDPKPPTGPGAPKDPTPTPNPFPK